MRATKHCAPRMSARRWRPSGSGCCKGCTTAWAPKLIASQESISNVLQHAPAHNLRVAVAAKAPDSEPGVAVMFNDAGDGFVRAAIDTSACGGKGLATMPRRAELLSAQLSGQPHASGTRLRLWLPLHRPAANPPR